MEIKRKVVKEVEETVNVKVINTFLVRVHKGEEVIAEKEFEYGGSQEEIADLLIDYIDDEDVYATSTMVYKLAKES